ncbi:spindle assembly abnormal protein 6 [Pancytospora philotis]|nr:spindle assembly abnormal protein 6 [Pancytospora philotis]
MFNGKVTLSTASSVITVKVDVIRHDASLEVRLIDTSNIFTLYICTITQSDFYVLKRDQDILVDYERFVSILASLFHCLSVSKLSATFNDGVLRFIENGEFRNICKLELRFAKPDDTQYRRYLADLLARMEGDNVKLIKENAVLRDRCANGDRELKDRLRATEAEMAECRRRYELQNKDLAGLEARCREKEDELARLSARLFEMEGENSQLKYDLEKYQRDNSQSFREQLKAREDELEASLKEVKVANEIIKEIRRENSELKGQKLESLSSLQKETEKNEELGEKFGAVSKKYKALEDKYKALKEDSRAKASKLQEIEKSNKVLSKELENAKNVYNHFYSKKVDEANDNYSETFTLRPESPPPR